MEQYNNNSVVGNPTTQKSQNNEYSEWGKEGSIEHFKPQCGTLSKSTNNKMVLTEILSKYSIANIANIIENEVECVMGNAPTLLQIFKEYGVNACEAFLQPLITKMIYSSSRDNSMTEFQIHNLCVDIIIDKTFRTLKLSEFILFTHKFCTGKFPNERIFKQVCGDNITNALNTFYSERNAFIARIEDEKRIKEAEIERKKGGTMSFAEWCKSKGVKQEETNIGRLMNKFKVKPNNNPLLNVGGNNE